MIHLAFGKGDWKHWPTTLNSSITLAIINVLTHQMQVYEASVIHASKHPSKHPSKQHPSNYPTKSLNCIFIETKWTNTHSYKRPPKLHPLHKSLNNCMTMNKISNGHWIPPVDQHWVTTLTPLFPTPKPPAPSIFPIPQDPPTPHRPPLRWRLPVPCRAGSPHDWRTSRRCRRPPWNVQNLPTSPGGDEGKFASELRLKMPVYD